MSKVTFCFGIHDHQPVGNFGWVISDAVARSYRPFLEVLSDFPEVRISLHFTGVLLDWLEVNDPSLLDLIQQLVQRNQVELLTGAHFEPILPIIPEADRIGQIRRQTEYTQEHFGVTPRGMWLAERVWEPQLPRSLKRAGVEYTILDDIHFLYAGLRAEQLTGYYLTEEQGDTVALFPISQRLRYTIPFADPEETIAELGKIAAMGDKRLAIYADDGEKFGVWPETDELCYGEKWLERFFTLLRDNRDWIEMKHFGEALDQFKPLGRVYLPTAAYSEMNEWALPAENINELEDFVRELKEQERFERLRAYVKGGYWRNFFSKYPESNHLHKRMLAVSRLLAETSSKQPTVDLEAAQKHLYAGQCNCPYWHGVFGGLYLPHLRGAIYQELVAAERELHRAGGSAKVQVEEYDFDCDGHDELIVTSPESKFIFTPATGGALTELDDFAASKNLIDLIGRRTEAYHRQLLHLNENSGGAKSIHERVVAKEEGLEKLLAEDWYRRGCFIDHFLGAAVSPEQFATAQYEELGDFVDQPYSLSHSTASGKTRWTLERSGGIWQEGRQLPLTVRKSFTHTDNKQPLAVDYQLQNRSDQMLDLRFAIEFAFGAFTFPPDQSHLLVDDNPVGEAELSIESCERFDFVGDLYNYSVALAADKEACLWRLPLFTVSLSEGGFEKVQQGTLLLPQWQVALQPGESWTLRLQMNLGESPQPATAGSAASDQAHA